MLSLRSSFAPPHLVLVPLHAVLEALHGIVQLVDVLLLAEDLEVHLASRCRGVAVGDGAEVSNDNGK